MQTREEESTVKIRANTNMFPPNQVADMFDMVCDVGKSCIFRFFAGTAVHKFGVEVDHDDAVVGFDEV